MHDKRIKVNPRRALEKIDPRRAFEKMQLTSIGRAAGNDGAGVGEQSWSTNKGQKTHSEPGAEREDRPEHKTQPRSGRRHR